MRIVVRGIPAAQGSKRAIRRKDGGVNLVESSRAVGPWREAVRAETQRAMNAWGPYPGPVALEVRFLLPKPKSAPKRQLYPAKRPDLDKLLRALLDGLTEGGAWNDDAQVVRITAAKDYAEFEAPGCYVDVRSAEEPEGS